MVKLNNRQTKAIERLFKKMDLSAIAFDEGPENGQVWVYIQYGERTVGVLLGEQGIAIAQENVTL